MKVNRPFNINLLVIMVVALALTGLLACSKGNDGNGGDEQLPPNIDMALGDKVQLVEYKRGDKVWKIDSESATYSMGSGLLRLKDLGGNYFEENRSVYEASSREGLYNTEEKILDIAGAVRVMTDNGYVLNTNKLRYDFDKEVAVTSSPILIVGDGLEIEGVGLRVSLKDGVLEVRKDVRMRAIPSVLSKVEERNGK